MKLKNEFVNLNGLTIEMMQIFGYIEDICKEIEGVRYEVTITSGTDGTHMKGSKHYSGNAIDIRSRDMMNKTKVARELDRQIKLKYAFKYDVIEEKDHIHIEYDPKY